MELSEKDLKDIENLLIKDNPHSLKVQKKTKLNEFKNDIRKNKLILSPNGIYKNKKKDNIRFPKISLNLRTNTTQSNNENPSKLNYSNDFLIENQSINNNINNNKAIQAKLNPNELTRKERSVIVKNIFDQIRRKSKNIKIKSSNTDLKLFGELFPGPGQYNPNTNNINHNLRYKNLFMNNSNSKKNIIFGKNTERNIGPGTYNPIENFNYVSYAQNPKVFISSLGRPSFINENEINKNVGPGSYEISSSFDKNKLKKLHNYSNIIKENKKDKIKKELQNELNMINNTHFFNLEDDKKLISLKNDRELKNSINNNNNKKIHIYNIISQDNIKNEHNNLANIYVNNSNKMIKKHMNKNQSKKICITNDNLENYKNKNLLPIVKGNQIK